MKNTVFIEKHKNFGAKLVEFAGYSMPVEYSGIKDEHITVREKVGVFDVSHMGEIWIKGEKAAELVQKLTSNDISTLSIGHAQYSCFPNYNGGIVDDLLVYYYEENKYMLVVNASNIEKDYKWILEINKEIGAEVENASDNISQLAIQGPLATKLLQKLTIENLSAIKYYTFKVGKFADCDNVIISATGYTGSGGFELYFYNNDAEKIWDKIFEAGAEFGVKPIGLAARDTLRLEMGFCLYGNDINDETSPIEAGLGWITKFNENNNFVNKESLLKQKQEGISKKLAAFEMIDRGIPRKDYEIFNDEGGKIGEVTSGTMSPYLNKAIGLGYLQKEFAKKDIEIFIKVRKKMLKAKIVRLPFYKQK